MKRVFELNGNEIYYQPNKDNFISFNFKGQVIKEEESLMDLIIYTSKEIGIDGGVVNTFTLSLEKEIREVLKRFDTFGKPFRNV